MGIQSYFSRFHTNIKVDTDELRDKRDILVDKIRASLKKAGHPLPDVLNQGSYIYGVGIIPLGNTEYDIDVGLDFPIKASEYETKLVRQWVYDAIVDHTKNVENRGPCIRVRYAAGYHVDLVIYARHQDSDSIENFQLALKDGTWRPAEPKKLKDIIRNARKPFAGSKDSSGSDQLQRVTRYLKRWNDIDVPADSPAKPFGLATLLLVINHLAGPATDADGNPDDLLALIRLAQAVVLIPGRIMIKKPTQEFEDVFAKLDGTAMDRLKKRFGMLLAGLQTAQGKDEQGAVAILVGHFGGDFPESSRTLEDSADGQVRATALADMKAAIPTFAKPARPWCNE